MTFYTCCGFPHGPSSMYAMILGVSSYLLAISSTWGCYFATVNFIFVDDSPRQFHDIERMGIGLFTYEDITAASDLTCRLYSRDQMNSFDLGFQAARTCGILANILIGLSMIFLIFLSCTVVRKSTLRVVGAMLIIGGILEGFTFLLYLSDVLCATCQFFFGSGLALMCSVVTVINGIVVCRIPEVYIDDEDELFAVHYDEEAMKNPAGRPTDSYDEDDSSHSSQSSSPRRVRIQEYNGRQQIVKTIVGADGSRAVEETTILSDDDLIGEAYQ